jgi:hypothetical protein
LSLRHAWSAAPNVKAGPPAAAADDEVDEVDKGARCVS